VQAGYGRLGDHLWSFVRHGLAPDLVTLGKPMGNGYPVAAVVTRRDVLDEFKFAGRVFSTFGGNPVAARAALAVLDVIEDERLIERARVVGERLRDALRALGRREILDVRGRGLLIGVEVPDADSADHAVNALRREGVLISSTGKLGNVLKIRPPLVFGDDHATLLVDAVERVLAA
jgi:4-aminobutyrate aminotransferase-like enzyme